MAAKLNIGWATYLVMLDKPELALTETEIADGIQSRYGVGADPKEIRNILSELVNRSVQAAVKCGEWRGETREDATTRGLKMSPVEQTETGWKLGYIGYDREAFRRLCEMSLWERHSVLKVRSDSTN